MRGQGDEGIAERCSLASGGGLAQRHEGTASAVAQHHDRLGPAPAEFGDGSVYIDDATVVKAIGVVVHVAGGESEYRVASGGQEGAGVVDAEVAPRVGEHHRGTPGPTDRGCPQDAAHDGTIGADQSDGLLPELDTGIVIGVGPIPQERPPARQGSLRRW